MSARNLARLGALGVVLAVLSPARAHARRSFPLIFGAGETITHYADAHLSGDPELAATLGFHEPAIG